MITLCDIPMDTQTGLIPNASAYEAEHNRPNITYFLLYVCRICATLFIVLHVIENKPTPDDVGQSSPALKSWMVYALAFSIVYSLIAWPCIIRVCGKTASQEI